MRQLTIYLDNQTEKRIRQAAKSARMSLSKWVATLVFERTQTSWPQSVCDAAGAWKDLPLTETLRDRAPDAPREPL